MRVSAPFPAAVTTPFASTVKTLVLLLDHAVVPGTTDPSASNIVEVNAVVSPSDASLAEPGETLIATGTCSTTTVAAALRFSKDAVSIPEPFAIAVTPPLALTVNTPMSLLDHLASPGTSAPLASVMAAAKAAVSPMEVSRAESGERVIATGT